MRRMFFISAILLSFACTPSHKELQLHIVARTVDQDPVSDAKVSLNGKVLGKTDNFGLFEITVNMPIGGKELNLVSIAKKSDIHKFKDALIYITEQALDQARTDIYLKATLKIDSPVARQKVSQVAGSPDVAEPKASPAVKPEIKKLVAQVPPKVDVPILNKILKKPKTESAPQKLATVTAPNVFKKANSFKRDEELYNKAKKSIESNNPYDALATLKIFTTHPSGRRNFNLGILCGAHINEAIANYMVAERYLSRKDMKLAHKHYAKSVDILDQSLKHINSVPEQMRKNFIVEARFNRALAIQKMYVDLALDSYKLEAYRAWRGVYMSLNRFDSKSERRTNIQKFAAQSMKDLGDKMLY